MKKLNLILMITALFSLSLVSCDKDDENVTPMSSEPTKNNIVQLAQENGFNSLAAALTRAGLVEALQADGSFTVFAPTDEAFDGLLEAIGQQSIDDVPVEVLQEVLLYHVIPSKVMSSQITAGDFITLEGSSVNLGTMDGVSVNDAMVQAPFDVEASNGVIHTVDQVLVPASVAQFVNTVLEPAYFNNNFTSLIAAAAKADLVTTLLNTPNLTIFAPTNRAFESAGIVIMDTPKETLASVLTYHVIGTKVMSSEISREAVSLNSNKLFFTLSDAGAYINGNTMISYVDITSGSGVVHVIDQVLLPPNGNLVETAVSLSELGEFSSLVAALQRTLNEGSPEQNLINVLSSDGPFTIFAPNNNAFQQLLNSRSDWNTLGDIPLETLISVLTYHVVPARAYDKDLASALQNGQLPTALGTNINVDLNTLMINESAKIVQVNINATNGVIHEIDQVLIPN